MKELQGTTKKYRTPEGSVYVTVARDGDGAVWVNTTVGKGGTQVQAAAFALSALVGTALRSGVGARKIILCLRGVTHEGSSSSFGLDALSMPDALGMALEGELR